jgi:type II secretory pathway component PulF
MDLSSSSRLNTISLDQVAALGDEIAALVRAGVPLERGLTELAADLPGGLGKLTARIADRLNSGESLDAALAEEGADLPATTAAVIRAGLRSGNLAAALESHAASSRRIGNIRTTAGLALLYPVMVVILCWLLFWFYVAMLMPGIKTLEENQRTSYEMMERLSTTAAIWGPGGPILLILVLTCWWWFSKRSGGDDPRDARTRLGWVPSARRIAQWNRQAIFAESLSLLIENDVPLPEAVRLAAGTVGGSSVKSAGLKLAELLDAGQPAAQAVAGIEGLPPLVVWLLQSAGSKENLVRGLRHASETYLERAEDLARWLTVTLPVLLTSVFAGTVVFCYTLAILLPWFNTLLKLSEIEYR